MLKLSKGSTKNRLEKLEKVVPIPVSLSTTNYKYTEKDWSFSEMVELVTKLTPALIKKREETNANWGLWAKERTTEELRELVRLFKEHEANINTLNGF